MNQSSFKNLLFLIGLISAATLVSCSKKVVYPAPSALAEDYVASLSKKKQLAYRFVTSPKSDDRQLEGLLGEQFISRDIAWGGSKSTFRENRKRDNSFSAIEPIRILQDDSLVALHSRMYGDTLRFRWDIVRFEGHQIQEHWSNVNDSIGLNPGKHSEIDGPTIPEQLEKTDTNRAHIARFMDQCMIREDGGAAKFFNFGLYTQHNRDVGDGLSGLLWGMLKMKMAGQTIKFKNNFHVIAEGNFVLSATEGYVGDQKSVFYDFFRVEENKIVEHWDIIAPVKKFRYYELLEE